MKTRHCWPKIESEIAQHFEEISKAASDQQLEAVADDLDDDGRMVSN
ncbi:MAG: hypothetical protein FD135_5173 [Comamonadaceae bacterium]|nr:MAG: hypothetical protein FD135_5173 [Comamonadaceae bacterium]